MEESGEASMVEEREELMVSLTGGDPTRRRAYFLNPSVNGTMTGILSPSLSFPSPSFDPQNWPLKVSFCGWRYPGLYLAKWVDLLLPRYKSVWEQVGIHDAIMNTTHEIRKDDDLVCGIVERWCPQTNTFVFVWGEATVTLEDVMVLGGFSVVGQPVSLPLVTLELKQIEERLFQARKEIAAARKKGCARQNYWLKKFMGSGSDIEHEAFLVYWLSKFVFPYKFDLIRSSIFSIAIHLARGRRIALAPAVLAAIYKDLTLLKQTIVDTFVLDTDKDGDDELALALWSPFLLVQLWAWERFPEVRPVPNVLKEGDTRSALWYSVKKVRIGNVRSVLDSASESFLWRPYVNTTHDWKFHKSYKEHNRWIHVDTGLESFDEELLSFARCIRACKLAGLGFVEQYLPHRVAMQFGMDQDLPADIRQSYDSSRIAWSNYCKPIGTMLYIPPRLFESGVTIRYFEWWKQCVLFERVLQQPGSSNRLKQTMAIRPSYCNEDDEHSLGKPRHLKIEPVTYSGDDRMVAKPMQGADESEMVDDVGIGGSGTAEVGENDTKTASLTQTTVSLNGNAGEDRACKYESIALGLEIRLTRVEKFFAELKAAKFGCRKPAKDG